MGKYFISGATGFVGSHVADRCVQLGHEVVTVARPTSATGHLEKLGAKIFLGDLKDPATLSAALEGVEVVVHCAAKVGDWGPIEEYRAVNVEGLRGLLEAAKTQPLKRFVHLSSLGVYEARHHYGTDETEPLPEQHMDGYTQTKVESEKLALEYQKKYGLPLTVLRPGFIYGPRDRTVLPAIRAALKEGRVVYINGGRAALNTTYVGNLVDAIFLAIDKPNAVGEVFNITDGEFVSKRQFFEAVADGFSLPRPRRSIPLWLARFLARVMEWRARRRNAPTAPRLTMAKLKFIGLNLDFSIAKARTQLGYEPKVGFQQGIREAIEWFRQNEV